MRIYIGGISYGASLEDVRNLIAEAGLTLQDITMPMPPEENPRHLHRGFAFAEVIGAPDEQILRRLDGRELHGRELRVSIAHARRYGPQTVRR